MNTSEIIEIIFVLIQVHFYLLLLLGNLFGSHISDKFVNILILNFFLLCSHDVLDVLIHHIHPLLLSHEPLHGVLVVHSLHFIVGTTHYLCHA